MKHFKSWLNSIFHQNMVVGSIVSITILLFQTTCKSKYNNNSPKLKTDCPDSVFYDLRLADQQKNCVKTVKLIEAGLKKFPVNIFDYPNLTHLNLKMNDIDTIPDAICTLTKLNSLILSYGSVKYLPACISNLKNLKNLDLLDNDLAILPETIGDLSSLERLNLKGNNIITLPKSIIRLKKLQYLSVSDAEGECHLSDQEKAFILANLPKCNTNFGPER